MHSWCDSEKFYPQISPNAFRFSLITSTRIAEVISPRITIEFPLGVLSIAVYSVVHLGVFPLNYS